MQSDKDIFCGWSQHTDEHEPRSHFALLQHLQNMNHMHNLSHLTHIHHLNQFTLLKQEVNLIDVKRKKAIRLLPIRVAGEENQEETSKNKIVKTRAKSKAEGTGATVLLPLHSVRTIDKELLRGR